MNSLTIASVVEANRLSSENAHILLAEIDIRLPNSSTVVETLRLAQNTEAVIHLGNTYTPFPFEISLASEAGEAPSVSMSAQDVMGVIRQRLTDYGGGTGFIVRIIGVGQDNLNVVQLLETFKVRSASAKDYGITVSLGSENLVMSAFPRRRQFRGSCPWIYKGAQCAYAGAIATCDRTLSGPNGCQVHANTRNFGGFPSLDGA